MNRTHIGLGIFVVATVGLLVWLAQSIGAIGGRAGSHYELRLAHAAGLVENNAVKIAGVSVGRIEKVSVDHDVAVMRLAIDREIVLHEDARAIVRAKSLLGEKYLQIEPGTRDTAILASGSAIPNVDVPFEIDEVLNALEPILGGEDSIAAALAPLASQLNELLADASGKNGKPPILTRAQIDKLVDDITATSASVRRLSEENEEKIGRIVDRTNELLEDPRVDRIIDNVEGITDDIDKRLPKLLERADSTLAKADEALTKVQELTAVLNEDRRRKIGLIIDDAAVATANVREVTDGLKGVAKSIGPLVKSLGAIADRAAKIDEHVVRQFLQREGMKIYFGSKKKAEESLGHIPED